MTPNNKLSAKLIIKQYRLIVLIGCYLACAVNPVHGQANKARTILTRMLGKYENAQSYQDSAILRVFPRRRSLLDNRMPTQTDQLVISFKTYFRRPRMFRFDWLSSPSSTSRNSVIWFDGEHAHSWIEDERLKDHFFLMRKPDFDALIQDTIDPSGGMVLTIPGLLITDLTPYTFGDVIKRLSDTSIVRRERVDGEVCYVIKGKASNVPWVFWVGQKTLFLRKMRSFYSIGSFHEQSKKGLSEELIAEEIHQQIQIDSTISEDVFHYRPQVLPRDKDLTK